MPCHDIAPHRSRVRQQQQLRAYSEAPCLLVCSVAIYLPSRDGERWNHERFPRTFHTGSLVLIESSPTTPTEHANNNGKQRRFTIYWNLVAFVHTLDIFWQPCKHVFYGQPRSSRCCVVELFERYFTFVTGAKFVPHLSADTKGASGWSKMELYCSYNDESKLLDRQGVSYSR